jgi:hypothetical protein
MIPRMLRIITAALFLLSSAAAHGAERRYTVSGFDKVEVSGPFKVTLATARSPSAVATGSPEALERVSVVVEGRTLRIRPNRSAWGSAPRAGEGGVRILVTTHELSSAALAGSGSLQIDKARAMRFDAALSGNGRLGISAVDVDRLNLQLLGAGSIAIGGKAKTLRAAITGHGGLEAAGLVADDAELTADTSGPVTLAVRRAAKIGASGAGDVTITGTPGCTVKATGTGRVSCGK